MGKDIRQSDKEENRRAAGARRHHAQRALIGLLHDLGVNFGDDTGIRNRNREHPCQGRKAEQLEKNQGPEQLVNRANHRAEYPHDAQVKEQRNTESGDVGDPDPEESEGDRVQKGGSKTIRRVEVGGQEAEQKPLHFRPRVYRSDGEIGKQNADQGHAEEGQRGAAQRRRR